ncbi:DUF5010 domain-containing protein [Coprobacter sp.]
MNKQLSSYLFTGMMACIIGFSVNKAEAQEVFSNNWYVGNTEAGEWIRYKQVYLAEGDYRFTTRVAARRDDCKLHLELNNDAFGEVNVPTTQNGEFELVHLGHKHLPKGYYDIKLVFDTDDINCDMIFIRKSSATSNNVLDDDIQYSLNWNDPMPIFAITATNFTSSSLAKCGDKGDSGSWTDKDGKYYTTEQMRRWYKQQLYTYTPENTEEAMDQLVSELAEAKVEVAYMHGRGDHDQINNVDDRLYTGGPGAFGPRLIKRFVDAVKRSPYAKDHLKMAYFVDNAVFPRAYDNPNYGNTTGKTMEWGDTDFQEYIWNYMFKPWYEVVPKDMLYIRPSSDAVPIQLWTANFSEYDYNAKDNKILEFLEYIENKMDETFGLKVDWILPDNFWKRDPRTFEKSAGIQGWFTWGSNITPTPWEHKGKYYSFAFNGGRLPLNNVWYNDWVYDKDPILESGTHVLDNNGKPKNDAHFSALSKDGKTPVIREIFENGKKVNSEWIVLESWVDWAEGSTWYRSDHSEYLFPNQYMALVREFADEDSECILLEAEGCDDYYDKTPGNSGGAYRYEWHHYKESDLDIYRPLHNISGLSQQGTYSWAVGANVDNFTVGFNDVWQSVSGNIVCKPVHGEDPSSSFLSIDRKPSGTLKKLALGKYYAWAICDVNGTNKVYRTELQTGVACNKAYGWVDVTNNQPMADLDLNMREVWGIDADGFVYYRNLHGKIRLNDKTEQMTDWVKAGDDNIRLKSITADDKFVWGFTTENKLVRMSAEGKKGFLEVANPYNLTKIDAGGGEVWGVNANNEIYRISSSGAGEWERVVTNGIIPDDKAENVSVGYEYVWIQGVSTSANRRRTSTYYRAILDGFQNKSVYALAGSSTGTGVDITNAEAKVSAFPNPFADFIRVDVAAFISEDAQISLYDMGGNLVMSRMERLQEGANRITLNTSHLNNGVYILKVISEHSKETLKLVK